MTRSSVGRHPGRLLLLVLCASLATTSCQWLRQLVTPPKRTPVISPAPPRGQAHTDIRGALLSVYYHAYGLDLLRPLPQGQPIALADAAKILAQDESFGASARRRRAISKLAAGAVMRPGSGPLRAAVEVLTDDARLAQDLFATLVAMGPPRVMLPAAWPKPLPILHPLIRRLLELRITAALDFLNLNPSPVYDPVCCSGVTVCEVDPAESSTDEAAVSFELSVRRDVADLREYIDPQDWDSCVPDYFADARYHDAECPGEASTGPGGAPAPPALLGVSPSSGSGWDGSLYEHFEANFEDGRSTWFKNRLQICGDWDEPKQSYRYHYALCRPGGSLKSKVLDYGETVGGIDKDCGVLLAWDETLDDPEGQPEVTTVRGIKRLQFSPRDPDPGLGLWTNLGLEVLVDGIADTALCCGPGATGTACNATDVQCIQAKGSSTGWKLPTPACEIDSATSPSCSTIEN